MTLSEKLTSVLHTEWIGNQILWYTETGSTNDEIRRLADEGTLEGLLVLAEYQTGGKGRRGRSWVTPAGSAIAVSLLLRPEIEPQYASMITLIMGLAVAEGIREYTNLQAQIKWPNDVVINGKKVCGILTEMKMNGPEIAYVVVGTGINTGIDEFPEELQNTAASLHKLTGKEISRPELLAVCMERFEYYYGQFLQTCDLSQMMDTYNELLAGKNGQVRVLEPGNEYTGIARGINAAGELLVEREDGTIEAVYAGEVSVRGIYGYI